MWKVLVKKEFTGIFRSYFVNSKTGKARSKGSIALFFVLFAFLMLILCGVFFSLAYQLKALLEMDLVWLYYALLGVLSVALGLFGSVFNTYVSLYLPKDNDLLLSLPIPPTTILLARMTLVFGLSLLYSGVVWLPTLIFGWINTKGGVLPILYGALLLFVIAFFVTALTCVLGWVVALAASRLKNKSLTTVLVSVIFLALYYFVVMRMSGYIETILLTPEKVGEGLRKWGNLFYHIGNAASGDTGSFLFFTLLSFLLCAACLYALSRSFIRVTTRSVGERRNTKSGQIRVSSPRKALFRRELKRFISNPNYMLNSALPVILLPVIAVVFLIRGEALGEMLEALRLALPELNALLPPAVFLIVAGVASIHQISTPSVSLEGKTLWIVRSLPVSGKEVLRSKLELHVAMLSLPVLVAVVLLGCCLHIGAPGIAAVLVSTLAFLRLSGSLGLIVGLLNANVHWTTESIAYKGLNVLLSMLLNWLLVAAVVLLYWLLRKVLSGTAYLLLCGAVLALADTAAESWLYRKGAQRFAAL